jgi:chromosomal replication initiation ATPase DnaA
MSLTKTIEKICFDYHISVDEVLCKTSKHDAARVKAIIGYVLLMYHDMTRAEIGYLLNVHHYTVWRYKQIVVDFIKLDPELEDKLKKYSPGVW